MYHGDCTITKFDTTGQVKEDDVAVFMTIEGGFLLATVIFEVMVLLRARQERCRTQQNTKTDLKEKKIFDRLLFGFELVFCIIDFGLCIAGMIPYSSFISFVVKNKYFFFFFLVESFFVYFGTTYERKNLSSKDDVRLVFLLSNLIAIKFDVIKKAFKTH